MVVALVLTFCIALPIRGRGQTFNTVHSFSSSETYRPDSPLALSGNTLFGATSQGNAVYRIDKDGSNFAIVCNSGSNWGSPNGVVVSGQILYGTSQYGGWYGSIYKVGTNGIGYTVLKTFTNSDGAYPMAGLVLNGDTLYGTTSQGGAFGGGTVFKINTDGSDFAVLHNFGAYSGSNTDGASPYAALILSDGYLYGTALGGGTNQNGALFKLDTNGLNFAVLHTFSARVSGTNSDGASPRSALSRSANTLYGTASGGGVQSGGVVFSIKTDGNNFTVLHQFDHAANTSDSNLGPWMGVVVNGGLLFGVAGNYPTSPVGSVYRLNTDGTQFQIVHEFSPNFNYDPAGGGDTNLDGRLPLGDLLLSGNTLYGTTGVNGPKGRGTVFSLQLPCLYCPPTITSATMANGQLSFTWNTVIGNTYVVQYATDLQSTNWNDLGGSLVATNSTQTISDTIDPDRHRIYRVALAVP